MKEQKGNLWDIAHDIAIEGQDNWICITTNGFVKRTGECVMGRGCAREAMSRFPNLPKQLGSHILSNGNVPSYFRDYGIITFPVKHVWWEPADLELLRNSAIWLLGAATLEPDKMFLLPRPGCGNGQRDWESEVKPLLESLGLPDNVVVVSR